MNLTALPTLQKIVLLKLAARVCSTAEIKTLLADNAALLCKNSSHWILEIISSFGLPQSLSDKLASFMKPVIMEISSWILYIRYIHDEVVNCSKISCCCLDGIDLQENLRWTAVGLLDKQLMTLDLVRDERLDSVVRFVLACNCCSEADILLLWQMLSSSVRKRIAAEFIFLPVVKYWANRLETAEKQNYKCIPSSPFPCVHEFEYSCKYFDAMQSFYKKLPDEMTYYLFGTYGRNLDDLEMKVLDEIMTEEHENRVTVGLVNVDNVAGLRYFLQKFERIKRRKLLEVVARNHFISNELLVFCLSQMSCDQVAELLKSGRGGRVLSCLINSPWQESFWDFINDNSDNFTNTDFCVLLGYIFTFKIKGKWRDYDYISCTKELYTRLENL